MSLDDKWHRSTLEAAPRPSLAAQDDCLTCHGDPVVCASIPGLRHCEKVMREPLPPTPARRECEHGNAYNECNRCNTSFQPTPANGETPRTDAIVNAFPQDWNGTYAASVVSLARQLERELHEAGDGDTWREACHRTERELRKLQMEMPDYKQCCELREKAERELAEAQSATVPSKRESIVTTLGDDSILYLQPMLFDEGDRVEVTITLAPTDDRGAG